MFCAIVKLLILHLVVRFKSDLICYVNMIVLEAKYEVLVRMWFNKIRATYAVRIWILCVSKPIVHIFNNRMHVLKYVVYTCEAIQTAICSPKPINSKSVCQNKIKYETERGWLHTRTQPKGNQIHLWSHSGPHTDSTRESVGKFC